MKFALLLIIIIVIAANCSKSGNNTQTPPPPPVNSDTGAISINTITKKEINEFDINYTALPPGGNNYASVSLIWSTSADFSANKDSITVSATAGIHKITKLPQQTKYYVRIGATINSKRIYSTTKDFTTGEFKLMVMGYSDPPRGFSKDDTTIIFTNLQQVVPVFNPDTKVFFGSYECPLVSDQGLTISINIPLTIPSGKYKVKLLTRGMEATWPDSVEVLRGRWDLIGRPDIPGNPAASFSALQSYGTCYSTQKGYIVGGEYFNGPPVGFPDSQWPEYLMEFDGSSQIWSKRTISNPHYFENPHCYYFNNAIYVVASHEFTYNMHGTHGMSLKKIHRLDLSTLSWSELQDVPYPTNSNMASFEINNEFYVGMGLDSANRSQCCGTPLPAKKFWKYNPASGAFTALANFPGGHQSFPTCFSINGKGYAFYGAIPIGDAVTAVTFTQELWEYDPALNTWKLIALPSSGGPPAGEKYQISVYNGKAYFLTAQVRTIYAQGYGFQLLNPCLEWDPVNNTYRRIAFPYDSRILQTVYRQANKFFYQPMEITLKESRAFSFEVEQ